MKHVFGAALLGAAVLAGSGATAATLFDLRGSAANSPVYTQTADGIGLTVNAYLGNSFFGVFAPINVTQTNTGLGATYRGDNTGQLDGGLLLDEFLVFTFDQVVRLGTVLFGAGDPDGSDDWDIWVDNGAGWTQVAFDDDANPFDLLGYETTRFAVGADARDDDFRVKELTVAAVPVPAAGLLLVGALGGLAALRRRKALAA